MRNLTRMTATCAEAIHRILFGGAQEGEDVPVHQLLAEAYGREMVNFSSRSFEEALQQCVAENKPLFLYIHATDLACPSLSSVCITPAINNAPLCC
jgi:hypothetical protein